MIVGIKQEKITIELTIDEAIKIKAALARTSAKGQILDSSMELEGKLYDIIARTTFSTNPINPT
jgi:hypothetical protein